MRIPLIKSRWIIRRRLQRGKRGVPLDPPSEATVGALAEAVYSWRKADSFRFDVVGSYLDPDEPARDLDIIVRPKRGAAYRLSDVESVLLALEYHGLKILNISVDATFRELSETQIAECLRDGIAFSSYKLDAPTWHRAARSNPEVVRRAGRCLVHIRRPVSEASYFTKLPVIELAGRKQRVFREAVALRSYLKSIMGSPVRSELA